MANEEVTTVGTLGTQSFVAEKYLMVYPNPAGDVLHIDNKAKVTLHSIEVYNMLGRLALAVPHAQGRNAIDVAPLKTGSYFIKFHSDKGISTVKFVKK